VTGNRQRIAPGIRGFALALALAGAGAALVVLLGGPEVQVGILRGLGDLGADPVDGVLAALTLVAQVLVAYLLLTVLLATAGRIPGFIGRVFRVLFRMVAVPVVRRAVEGALGGALVVGMALGPAPAWFSGSMQHLSDQGLR
jgi:hypothetical protein